MALKKGTVPVGFKLHTRRGKRKITSVIEAFPRCGLPQETFLAACEISFSSLVSAYKDFHKFPEAASERDIEQKLGELLTRNNSSQSLVEIKPKK
jgi:hypothetical protein